MQFSVIYSVDVPRCQRISIHQPPKVRRLWDLTEDDKCYEYGHLEGRWSRGRHRKWCAILSKQQFEEFVSHCNLFTEDVRTMGSLGAPGFGVGWAPAISFTSDDENSIRSAYVTPIPETSKSRLVERDWNRVRRAIIRAYR